jgi:hypothetical protein
MSGFLVGVCAVCVAILAEILLPGQAAYHAGWFNLLLLAVTVGVALSVRRAAGTMPRKIVAAALCAVGVAIVASAGIAYGLLAPDDATVIAAPDATVRVADLGGTLHFFPDASIALRRGASSTVVPPSGRRLAGTFVLRSIPRTDIAVDVADLRGGHLTITQPNGTVFLSPVLTMQARQTISGVALPFDTFAVPAVRRIVHVVLFDPHQAVALLPTFDAGGRSAILFAVDDQADRPIPGGIAVTRDGGAVSVAGLHLLPVVTSYPALTYLAVPMLPIVGLGVLFVLAGALWPKIGALLDARRANGKMPQR